MQELIKQAALIDYIEMTDVELTTLFANFLSTLVELPQQERNKYKSIYWKLTFACQKTLGFKSKNETLESGSKKEIRRKQYEN